MIPSAVIMLPNKALAFALTAAAAGLNALHAQQAPIGIPVAPLTAGSYVFDTAEQHKLKVTVLARGIPHPFGMTFLNGGVMLITERGGNLRVVRDGVLDPKPAPGVPKVLTGRGLLDIVAHPKFADNKLLFFTYVKPGDPLPPAQPGGQPVAQGAVTLARARWDGNGLADVKDLFSMSMGPVSGSRLAFGKDGFIYMTTGAMNKDAQDLSSHRGKVLRLTEDGAPAPGNPFIGRPNAKAEIFSIGHRDQLGITIHPDTGAVIAEEHGPNGGDEVNVILPGRDYGWPTSSFGRNYDGPRISETPLPGGVEAPIVLWIPSVGPSGMMFYTGDKFPQWKGNLFVGSARWGEIPGTGSIQRVVFNAKLEEIRRESLLGDLHQRFRDVRQGPDGLIYAITDENDGALLRLEPAQ